MPRTKRTADEEAAFEERGRHLQAERASKEAQWRRWSDSAPSEYREGFIDGYLRAHADGQEYLCSVEGAELAFGEYLAKGGRSLPRKDYDPYAQD